MRTRPARPSSPHALPPALLAAALIAACGGRGCACAEPPNAASAAGRPAGAAPAWKGETLPTTSGSTSLKLDALPAELELPSSNLPPGATEARSFPIPDLREHPTRNGAWWSAELPFRMPDSQKRFDDGGVSVTVDGRALTFTIADPAAVASAPAESWRVFEGRLAIFTKSKPGKVVVTRPGATADDKRLNLGLSGLEPAAFSPYTLTLKNQTREGMLINAPGKATWRALTLPPAARMRGWAAIAPTVTAASDGAELIAEITVDGATTEVGRVAVAGRADAFVPWSVDLSAYAGKTVDLTVRSSADPARDQKGHAFHDYVFLGAPHIVGTPKGKLRHILVIGMDTTRPDHFSINGYPRDTTPELDAWAKDAVLFDRAWTSAPRTRPSFRAATTGRLPLDAVCAENIGEAFDAAGFATAGVVSNIHLNPHFDFQKGFDLWWLDGKALVNDEVDRALAWVDENQDRDLYMFVHIMDPHIFYKAPPPYTDKYTAGLPPLAEDEKIPKFFNRWQVSKWMKSNKLSDNRRDHIEAMYDAELAWTSHELDRLLQAWDALEGDNLVVIHSDHGEEFWEHGGFEHNHTLYNDVTSALLWVKPPGGTGGANMRSLFPATLQDIAPTLYDFAGLTAHPPTDGVSLLPAIRGEAQDAWTRPIPVGHLQYDANRWGVIWEDRKYVLVTGSGQEELYDLAQDPGEKVNLAGQEDTLPYVAKLAEAHHMKAGPGWRITVQSQPDRRWVVALPRPAVAAGVIDPELITRHPANQEWGEKPRKTVADVGAVTLSADGASLTFQAGPVGDGVLYVMFDERIDASGASVRPEKGEATPVTPDANGLATVGPNRFTFAPGVVIEPPPGEYERMLSCNEGGETSRETICQLCAMGYVHGASCEGCGAPGAAPPGGAEGEADHGD
jgi:arylsulfatase A-like enzyme